ncbi:unnamed protein product [Timema podura]|uniref:THAP-type domain-containing protein n=1 Tax=Timema podura TaxID=61482 RepID=A0ABN7P559_TIMPD|nr:unnamed protein product [Timema podura]
MSIKCVAYNCKSTTLNTNSDISFHEFPLQDTKLLRRWLEAIHHPRWQPSEYNVLCSTHFTPDCFRTDMDVPTLKENAFPTIFNFTEDTLSDMHMDEELMDCSDIEEISESEDEDFGKNEAFLVEHGVKQICRVCGSPTEEVLYPIFGQQGEVWNIAEKISRCLPIKVMPSDKISLLICAECIKLLNTSYELIATSLRAEAEFLKEYPEDWWNRTLLPCIEEEEEDDYDYDDDDDDDDDENDDDGDGGKESKDCNVKTEPNEEIKEEMCG